MLNASIPRTVETRKPPVSTTSETSGLEGSYNPVMGRPRKSDQPRNPWAVKIGGRIGEAMKAKKWGLRELAAHTHMLVGTLGMYATGSRMPKPKEILAIATATGESAAWLMCLTDDKQPDRVRNSDETMLLRAYRIAGQEERRRALDRLGAVEILTKQAAEDELLGLDELPGKRRLVASEHSKVKRRGVKVPKGKNGWE